MTEKKLFFPLGSLLHSQIFSLWIGTSQNVDTYIQTWNIPVWTIPAFPRTMAAVASPYPFTLGRDTENFSQDALGSLFNHWDIVSIKQRLA